MKAGKIWVDHLDTMGAECFACEHKLAPQYFTRKRALSFRDVMGYLLKMAKKSLQIDANQIGDITGEEPVSKQSLSKARYKVGVSAFQALHADAVRRHYEDSQDHLWQGYRVIGGDGSTLQLPKEGNLPFFFGDHHKYVVNARVFQYIDLMEDTILTSSIMPYSCSENEMAKAELDGLVNNMRSLGQQKQLYVYDRGFPSHHFVQQHLDNEVDFLFRCPRNFLSETKPYTDKKLDADFNIFVGRKDAQYEARIIIRYLSSGQPLILLTSLVDRELHPAEALCTAYHHRWRCEESYKTQKLLLQMENFSSKTVHGVLQEFWATVLMATYINFFMLEEQDKLENRKVNKTVVFASIRDDFLAATLGYKDPQEVLKKLDYLLKRHTLPTRKNRSYPRRKKTHRREGHVYRRSM